MSDSEGDSTSESGDFPQPPTSINPYEVLSIPPTSTATEIRSAYRRLALQTHPDKVAPTERDAAHTKFQELAFAYAVLSDDARRARYDATGSTSESLFDEGFNWKDFFRSQVKDLVSPEAVEKFKREYQGSDEERTAVLQAYTATQGSLDMIFERVMVSSVLDDEERFRIMIQGAIDAGEVKAYSAFTKETAKSKKARRVKAEGEKKEAEEYAKELGVWDVLFGEKKKRKEEQEAAQTEDTEMQEAEEEEEEEEEEEKPPKIGGKGKGRTAKKAEPKSEPKSKPATKGKKAKKEVDTSALEALIKGRQANRQAGFLANMEARYGANGSEVKKEKERKKKGRGKKPVEDETEGESKDETEDENEYESEDETEDEDISGSMEEPTEEEFQAARKRIGNRTGKKRTGEKEKVVVSGGRRSKRVKRS